MSDTQIGTLLAAVDLGGTKILSAVAAPDGNILATDQRSTEAEQGVEAVLERIVASLQETLRRANSSPSDIARLAIAAPGPIDQARGLITEAPNLPGWINVPLRSRLRRLLGVPIYLENDANAAAIGEHRYGAGRGSRHMLYLTVSTGIGGGIIIDGRLYRGTSGAAGELGHIVVDAGGPRCRCGSYGCLEVLASGTALAREGAAAVERGEAPLLERLAGGAPVTAELVADAARAGEETARRLITTAGRYLGLGLTSLVNIFNPQVLVLGGGAMKIGQPLLDPAVETMQATAFPQAVADVSVRLSALEDEAAVRGALALIQERQWPR